MFQGFKNWFARRDFGTGALATRLLETAPSSIDVQARTVDIVGATDTPIRRREVDFLGNETGAYDEVLDMSPGAVRLGRLNSGGPFLDSHDYSGTRSMIGGIVPGSVKVGDGRLTARVKFSRSEAGERAFQDLRDGILRSVSVGYRIHQKQIDDTTSPPTYRITDWEPHEVSAVAIPADQAARFRGVESAIRGSGPEMFEAQNNDAAFTARVESAMAIEFSRRDTISETARTLGLPPEFAEGHIRDKTSTENFFRLALGEKARMDREVGPPTTA